VLVFYRRLGIHTTQDHYVITLRHPQNRKYITYHNAVREKPSHGHKTHKTLVKFGRVVFELCEQTDRQTDRQTNKSYGTMRHVRSGKNFSLWPRKYGR